MNIILKLTDVLDPIQKKLHTESILFLDTRKNMIMDGEFTKMLFATPHFTMDGVFIKFPICFSPQQLEKFQNKNILWFQPFHANNISVLQDFAEIEKQLIDYYMKYKGVSNKTPQYSLHNHLYSGSVKVYSSLHRSMADTRSIRHIDSNSSISSQPDKITILSRSSSSNLSSYLDPSDPSKLKSYCVKISGIWESKDQIGITYKILEN
jgi:hypothetical protein